MAAPHVSATPPHNASGVLGRRPTPAQLTARLKATAASAWRRCDKGSLRRRTLNAGAATAPAGPERPVG